MWAEGWPHAFVIVSGVIVDFWVIGMALATSKVISVELRRVRRGPEPSQKR
jgi:hypothetical protein